MQCAQQYRVQQQLFLWFRSRRSEALARQALQCWSMHVQSTGALNFAYVHTLRRHDAKLKRAGFLGYKEHVRHWRMKKHRSQIAARRILARRRAWCVTLFVTWQVWTDKMRFLRRNAGLCAARNVRQRLLGLTSHVIITWCTHAKSKIDARSRLLERQLRSQKLKALQQWKSGCRARRSARVAAHARFRMDLELMRTAMTVLAVHTRDRTRSSRLRFRIERLCARRAMKSLEDFVRLSLSLWYRIMQNKRRALLWVESRWRLHNLSSIRFSVDVWVQWVQEIRRTARAHAHQVALKTLTLHLLLWMNWAKSKTSRRRIEEALARDRRTATLSSIFLALKYAASIGENRRTKLQVFCSVRGQATAVDIEIPFVQPGGEAEQLTTLSGLAVQHVHGELQNAHHLPQV